MLRISKRLRKHYILCRGTELDAMACEQMQHRTAIDGLARLALASVFVTPGPGPDKDRLGCRLPTLTMARRLKAHAFEPKDFGAPGIRERRG